MEAAPASHLTLIQPSRLHHRTCSNSRLAQPADFQLRQVLTISISLQKNDKTTFEPLLNPWTHVNHTLSKKNGSDFPLLQTSPTILITLTLLCAKLFCERQLCQNCPRVHIHASADSKHAWDLQSSTRARSPKTFVWSRFLSIPALTLVSVFKWCRPGSGNEAQTSRLVSIWFKIFWYVSSASENSRHSKFTH